MENIRSLGYSEMVEYYLNKISPHNIVVIGCLDKKINHRIINEAWRKIQILNPLLSASISLNNNKFSFQKVSENDLSDAEYHESNNFEIEKMISKIISIQLSDFHNTLAKLIHIVSNNNSYLFFLCQHTVSDGISAKEIFLELIASIDTLLSSENIDYLIKPIKPSLDNLLYPNLIEENKVPFLKDNIPFNLNLFTGVFCLKITQKNTLNFFEICKKSNISVTTALTTIISRIFMCYITQNALTKGFRYKILVNMRNYIKGIQVNDLGFYSGCVKSTIIPASICDNSFENIHRQFKSQVNNDMHIRRVNENKKTLLFCDNIQQFSFFITEKLPGIGLSNMGIIEEKEYKNFQLLDLHMACDTHIYDRTPNNFFICANTYKNTLYLNLLYPEPIFTKARIHKIANEILHKIENLQVII